MDLTLEIVVVLTVDYDPWDVVVCGLQSFGLHGNLMLEFNTLRSFEA